MIVRLFKNKGFNRIFGLEAEPWRLFKGIRIKVRKALPPTNIIWENIKDSEA